MKKSKRKGISVFGIYFLQMKERFDKLADAYRSYKAVMEEAKRVLPREEYAKLVADYAFSDDE